MSNFEEAVAECRGEGRLFSGVRQVFICRAPGRLDLMGGNVDYTGGMVFQATIREATWGAAQRRDDGMVEVWNPQLAAEGWRDRVKVSVDELTSEEAVRRLAAGPGTAWCAYVLGAVHYLRVRYPEQTAGGLSLYLSSEVPLNKGVSSSAAVEVATMKSAAACLGLELMGVKLAEACQWVENVIANSACGIMDQAASVLGDEGCVLPLLCQPYTVRKAVRLPAGLRCWAVDSGVRHAVTGAEYEAARAAAFVGYRMICEWEGLKLEKDASSPIPRFTEPRWRGYLSNLTPSLFRSRYELRLPETISGDEILATGTEHPDPFTAIRPGVNYRVRNCVRYATEENQRIQLFIELAQGSGPVGAVETFRQMGELMYQSHWSYTETGLGCKETDELIDLVREHAGEDLLFGAKITGGGAGGTVAVLGSMHGEIAFQKVVDEYARRRGVRPYVFRGSSAGADVFGVKTLGDTVDEHS